MKVTLRPGVNFINVLRTNFLYERRFLLLRLAWRQKFVQKMHAFNVDEIDGSQIHLQVSCMLFIPSEKENKDTHK